MSSNQLFLENFAQMPLQLIYGVTREQTTREESKADTHIAYRINLPHLFSKKLYLYMIHNIV